MARSRKPRACRIAPGWCQARRGLRMFRPVRLVLWLAVLLALPAPALAQFAGAWEGVEYDPIMPENDFFGQFRYRMEVREENGLFTVVAPRTGAKFAPAPLKDGRFVSRGEEPNRGPATLDVRVAEGRFEGAIV